MSWKTFVAGYLHFSRKDRIGILTLLVLIMLVYALPYLSPSRVAPPVVLDDSLKEFLGNAPPATAATSSPDNTEDGDFDYNPAPSSHTLSFTKGDLFSFNPNTLDATGWRRLGLPEKTIRTLFNYRSKGGKFYKKEDLQKIWGLPKGFYEHVEGYIEIPERKDQHTERASFPERRNSEPRAPGVIDVNTADTTVWIALPGIGAKLANRIVNFRAKLGGFYSIEQVGTTYGLPDSTFQKIKPLLRLSTNAISKININTATKEILSAHPYISWKLANAVVAYREQHGTFQSVSDLRNIMIMDEKTFEQLKPYLSAQ